jgi:hypothetical protein
MIPSSVKSHGTLHASPKHPASQAKEVQGTLSKYLYNVHGDCDGFLLDGTHQVHFAPHMSAEILEHTKVGDRLTVHGDALITVDLLVGEWLQIPNGSKITDQGPPAKPL